MDRCPLRRFTGEGRGRKGRNNNPSKQVFLFSCLKILGLQIYIKVERDLYELPCCATCVFFRCLAVGFSGAGWGIKKIINEDTPQVFTQHQWGNVRICTTHLTLKGRYSLWIGVMVPWGAWLGKLLRSSHSVQWLCQGCQRKDLMATKSQ